MTAQDKPKRPYARKRKYRKPKGVGTPKHARSAQTAQTVKILVAIGFSQNQICRKLSIDRRILKREYGEEFELGKMDADATVGLTAYQQATGMNPLTGKPNWKDANAAMTRFWLMVRMGWKETTVQEHGGIDGAAIKIESLTDHQLALLIAKLGGPARLRGPRD